jgi:aspartyl-tRNA(Asn)/glutamyl-tRNA(Gln) amidotransferase subunit A
MKVIETAQKVQKGQLTATQAVSECLAKIKQLNPQINAFLEVFEEEALARAAAIDKKPQKGRLAGVAVAIKDNIMYKGHTMSCASKMLANYKAAYTASVVEKLLAEDAVIIGRANMDEFAMGSSNETSAFGPVKNPRDLQRVPGGSSGGSAAAVAAGMAPLALGSDTGGSIRQPAAFCGVCGIKPTYGLVSRYGLAAYASSADQIGPITQDAADNAYVLDILAGADEKDSTSQTAPEAKPLPAQPVVGIPTEFLQGLNPEITQNLLRAKARLQERGVKFKDISLPNAKYASACYYILTCSEASSNLARFDGLRYGFAGAGAADLEQTYLKNRAAFGPEVKRRIMLGAYSLGSAHAKDFYQKAQKARELIRQDFVKAFKELDAILTPCAPTTAFKFGEKTKDIIAMYLSDLYTAPVNLAGVCALSVPFGKDAQNLPIGVQLCGNYFEEGKLYSLANLLGE